MKAYLKKRIKQKKGFSLAEMMMVLLIVLMVSSIVAVGVPSAVRAYNKVVDASNAQVLISTAMTRLREELGTASEVSPDPAQKTVFYNNSLGYSSKIMLDSGDDPVIYIEEYTNVDIDYPARPLVSESASGKKLFVTYDTVAYENGVVTFTNLKVKYRNEYANGSTDNDLALLDEFKIRVLTI